MTVRRLQLLHLTRAGGMPVVERKCGLTVFGAEATGMIEGLRK